MENPKRNIPQGLSPSKYKRDVYMKDLLNSRLLRELNKVFNIFSFIKSDVNKQVSGQTPPAINELSGYFLLHAWSKLPAIQIKDGIFDYLNS